VRTGIAFVEAGMWKKNGRAACWTKLDCAAIGLSFLHFDSSKRNWDDFSTLGCKCWNTDHYLVWRRLH
jgi:hypothetical protein